MQFNIKILFSNCSATLVACCLKEGRRLVSKFACCAKTRAQSIGIFGCGKPGYYRGVGFADKVNFRASFLVVFYALINSSISSMKQEIHQSGEDALGPNVYAWIVNAALKISQLIVFIFYGIQGVEETSWAIVPQGNPFRDPSQIVGFVFVHHR